MKQWTKVFGVVALVTCLAVPALVLAQALGAVEFDPMPLINALPFSLQTKALLILCLPLLYAALGIARHFIAPASALGQFIAAFCSGWKHPDEVSSMVKAQIAEKKALKAAGGFIDLRLTVGLALALGALLIAAPARATGPGVYCISGCDQPHRLPARLGAVSDEIQVSSTVWVGPGIGILPFVYSGEDKAWSQVAAPAFSYGFWFRPMGWTATKSLLGVNLSLTADFSNLSHVDPILTAVLLDYITIGGGIRARFATGSQKGGISPLFALGFTTSFGGP
jgi:hypothetical protein